MSRTVCMAMRSGVANAVGTRLKRAGPNNTIVFRPIMTSASGYCVYLHREICAYGMKRLSVILCVVALFAAECAAQSRRVRGASNVEWERQAGGDSVLHITSLPVYIFNRKADLRRYQKMIRAVKKVYPLAVEASKRMENLDDVLSGMDKRKDRRQYTRQIETALKEELSPVLFKMTRYEGRILLKLIDRETDHTAYRIIQEFRSGFTAGFWQLVAKLFGNDLKMQYDPSGEDAMLEQIVLYYKAGLL